jgi:TRAP-type C4-dicarboxylate transport system permease large subunit
MLVMTLPITLPLVVASGFDPIWFGVFLVVMVELAQITPPVGFNLFVLQGMTGRPIGWIAGAALPFFAILTLACAVLTAFPSIALWFPNAIYSR